MGGDPVRERIHRTLPKVFITKETPAHPNRMFSQDLTDLAMGTCSVWGQVTKARWSTRKLQILCDSGAAFSCLSSSVLPHYMLSEIEPSADLRAVDASKNEVKILGTFIVDTVRLFDGENIALVLKNLKFAVLEPRSTEILLGCEVLSYLNFELCRQFASLCNVKIPRVYVHREWPRYIRTVVAVEDCVIVKGDANIQYCR